MIRNFQDGDIVTSREFDQFVSGKEGTAQGIKHRLRLFLGEYFLNVAEGTPWFQSILGKAPQDLAEINIKQRILTSQGVVGITDFNFETDSDLRKITVQASILDVNNEQIQLLLNEELL